MHGWERCSHPFSDSFRDCPKRGASNAQPINLARMRQAKWTEKPLCGDSRGQTASASEAFRTVSEGKFPEGRIRDPAYRRPYSARITAPDPTPLDRPHAPCNANDAGCRRSVYRIEIGFLTIR